MAQCSDCGVDVSPQVEVLQAPRPEKVLPGGAALIGLGVVTAVFAGQSHVPGRPLKQGPSHCCCMAVLVMAQPAAHCAVFQVLSPLLPCLGCRTSVGSSAGHNHDTGGCHHFAVHLRRFPGASGRPGSVLCRRPWTGASLLSAACGGTGTGELPDSWLRPLLRSQVSWRLDAMHSGRLCMA